MNSYWVQILDFPFHCSNVLCSLAQCILNSITQSRITPARGFLTSEQSTVYCVGHYCWRSEPEDWEPPTCEKNVGEEGRKQDQKSRCFTMDIENTPTPRKKKKNKKLFHFKMSTFVFMSVWDAHVRNYLDFSICTAWQQEKNPGAVFRMDEFDSWFSYQAWIYHLISPFLHLLNRAN